MSSGHRTVVLLDAYPYAVGGAHHVLARLATGLTQRGFRARVLLPAAGVTAAWFENQKVEVQVVPAPAALLAYGGRSPLMAARALPTYWLALRRHLRDVDVLWVNDLRGLLLTGPLGRASRVPVVWHVHARPPQLAGLHRYLARLPDKVVVPSRALAQDLSLGSRAMVLPNAVSPTTQLSPRSGPPCVVCVARLDPVKGIDALVRAHALLTSVDGPVRLLVAGSQQPGHEGERARLVALSEELGTRDRVELVGEVDDVTTLHREATVYAQPSRQESFGLAALEAMGSGLPVVVTSAGGLPELVGDAGVVVPVDDVRALAGALQALLDDPLQAKRLGAAARARACSHHDPETFVDLAAALCERLVAR